MLKKKESTKHTIQNEYYNYIALERFDHDMIMHFYQVVPEGIVKQCSLIMSMISAKLISESLAAPIEDFEDDIMDIKTYRSELYNIKTPICELEKTLKYVNNIVVNFNHISFLLELYYEGPDKDEQVANIILSPELTKYLYSKINAVVYAYETQYGEINLKDYIV